MIREKNILPLFSIIIPVYQSKKFLRKTVSCLQRQTYPNIEIILVDDGSTDGSADICDELSANDARIVVIHKINEGVSSARNLGIKVSRGSWLIFIDSDDLVSELMCESFWYYIKKGFQYDCVVFNISKKREKLAKYIPTDNEIVKISDKEQNLDLVVEMLTNNYSKETVNFQNAFGNNVVLNSPCAKAYRKSFIMNKSLFFNETVKYSEDLLFNISFLMYGARELFINSVIYFYRNNEDSVSHKSYIPNIINNFYLLKRDAEKVINDTNSNNVYVALDAYIFKVSLTILHFDIFRPGYSLNKSKKRFFEVVKSKKFSKLINWRIYNASKKYFDYKTKFKSILVLEQKFCILYLIYKHLNS